MTKCTICKQNILTHSRSISCSLCMMIFHVNCLPNMMEIMDAGYLNWLCNYCTGTEFPFNNVMDDNDFIVNMNEFFGNEKFMTLEQISFNPFNNSHDEDEFNEPLLDIDPDLQYFNNFANLQNYGENCHYYVEDSFNAKVKETNIIPVSLFHLNVRSLQKHFDDVEYYITNLQITFDIIAMSETWLTNSNCELFNLSGYTHVYQCRNDRIGGGVSIFINHRWNYVIREDLCKNESYIECIFIEIPKGMTHHDNNVLIGSVYRPPNTDIQDFNQALQQIVCTIQRENKLAFMLGDYNVNLLNADNHSGTSTFLDIFYSSGFFPLITKPTRMQNQSFTLIDNIFCNKVFDNDNCMINGIFYTDISDHFPIFTLYSDKPKTEKDSIVIKSRNFSHKNRVNFSNMLQSFDWHQVLNSTSCQEAFSIFHKNFKHMFDKCFPFRVVRSKYYSRKPWLTTGMKNSVKFKNKLFIKYKRHPTAENHNTYKMFRNKLTSLMRNSEKCYFEEQFNKNKSNLKKSWTLIKKIINKQKCCQNHEFLIDNITISDKREIANRFNDYFTNIGPTLSRNIPSNSADPMQYLENLNSRNSLYLQSATPEEITRIIKNLKDSSSGYDDITATIIKNTCQFYLRPLVHIINLSLLQGVFPNELKIARVVPLYKSGDSRLISNYRPVSILTNFSKLFEKVMYSRLLDFLNKYNILHDSQFGFRKNHNTISAIIVLIEKILNGFNNNDCTLGIFIDYKKAFDTINHQILLNKLNRYGIRGIAQKWIASYLHERQQYVCFNNYNSEFQFVTCGVPQGSILGPLLFILYLNDMTSVSNVLIPIIYADDSNLFLQGKDLSSMIDLMNCEMEKITDWVSANKLSVNLDKTYYMIFKTRGKKIQSSKEIMMLNHKILKVDEIKFLGVILDSHLTWDKHIFNIRNKISKSIGIINKTKRIVSQKTMLALYYSFVYPYLVYAIELWGSSSSQNLNILYKLQKKILRIMKNETYLAHTEPIFAFFKILNVHKLYRYQLSLSMFRMERNLCPSSVKLMFNDLLIVNEHVTRRQFMYNLPLFRLTICQKGFKYQGIVTWNFVLSKVDLKCSIHTFKKQLKMLILNDNLLFNV